MVELARRIDNLGRLVIPKELRNSFNIYEGCYVSITPTNDGILIRKSENDLQKDLQFIIDKYIAESGWSDAVLKLMEVQEELEFEPEKVMGTNNENTI